MGRVITETETVARAYDSNVRTYARELSKFRRRSNDITDLRASEDQCITRDRRRDFGSTRPFPKGKLRKAIRQSLRMATSGQ